MAEPEEKRVEQRVVVECHCWNSRSIVSALGALLRTPIALIGNRRAHKVNVIGQLCPLRSRHTPQQSRRADFSRLDTHPEQSTHTDANCGNRAQTESGDGIEATGPQIDADNRLPLGRAVVIHRFLNRADISAVIVMGVLLGRRQPA